MATKKNKHDSGAKRRRPKKTLSKSGKYFRDNPEAAKKKNAYNRKKKDGIETRAERAKKRRDAKKKGQDVRGKDYDHAVGKFVSAKKNRGRAGEGGRKKGVKKGRRKK